MPNRPPRHPWRQLPCPVANAQGHEEPLREELNVLPGITFYFPPKQMAQMRRAYTRARGADPCAFPTFHHFVLVRVTTGLADRCLVLAPGYQRQDLPAAGAYLATQLQVAARQMGVDQRTLLYWLVAPQDARREQRWQTVKAFCMRSVSARWGRRGCATPLIGLGAVGILVCCLLSFAEAIAAFLVQHPH